MKTELRPGAACMAWKNCPSQNCVECNCKQVRTCRECFEISKQRFDLHVLDQICANCANYDSEKGDCSEICHLVGFDDYCSFWREK